MKPKVFLSHSKKDKDFIERIANDLRSCGIDVWYDEWEIPPGESIRKKIFEDGITSCDLFFVYLTPNSIPSYWVNKELDGAFIHEIEMKNSFLILFVDQDSSRETLSLDLKTLNIPSFNPDNYFNPFTKLVSRIWNAYCKNELQKNNKENKYVILEKERNNALLENKILQMQQSGKSDFSFLKEHLEGIVFNYNGIEKNLLEAFIELKNILADETSYSQLRIKLELFFNDLTDKNDYNNPERLISKYPISEFTGELVLKGLVEIKTSDDLDQQYFLTKLGKDFINAETNVNND